MSVTCKCCGTQCGEGACSWDDSGGWACRACWSRIMQFVRGQVRGYGRLAFDKAVEAAQFGWKPSEDEDVASQMPAGCAAL